MILLNSNEIKSVHGAGAWDDFWESFGRSVADIMFDMSYSSHSREQCAIAKILLFPLSGTRVTINTRKTVLRYSKKG
jgi:hypothetical protein